MTSHVTENLGIADFESQLFLIVGKAFSGTSPLPITQQRFPIVQFFLKCGIVLDRPQAAHSQPSLTRQAASELQWLKSKSESRAGYIREG